MSSQIDDLKLPALDKYLETKYAYVKKRNFACEICNNFVGSNKQSLSAHKRSCKNKKTTSISTDVNSNTNTHEQQLVSSTVNI